MKRGATMSPEEIDRYLLNRPHSTGSDKPQLGWDDEDSTHERTMEAMDLAIARIKAIYILPNTV